MPIDVVCQCGRKASVPDAMGGKKGKCPSCGSILGIPIAGEAVEAVALPPSGSPMADRPQAALIADVVAADAPPIPARIDVRCVQCGHSGKIDPTSRGQRCRWCFSDIEPGNYLVYSPTIQRVHLVEAELSWPTMCLLAFKWAIASIPTLIFFALIYGLISLMIHAASEAPKRF